MSAGTETRVVDLVSSRVYPTLDRKPGTSNWVDAVGGLPSYIERIAKHLHYERGMSISHAIATAVNTAKRWARGGKVTKTGTLQGVNLDTQAKAAAAVAEWEAKKARARVKDLSTEDRDRLASILDLSVEESIRAKNPKCKFCDSPATKALLWAEGRAYVPCCDQHEKTGRDKLAENGGYGEIDKVINLSSEQLLSLGRIIDLALTKDGRKSYKKQGKWGHGFVPLDDKAKEAKAKGSPIARKRINRLYGTTSKVAAIKAGTKSEKDTSNTTTSAEARKTAKKAAVAATKTQKKARLQDGTLASAKSGEDKKKEGTIRASEHGATERTSTGRVATARRPFVADTKASQRLGTAGKNQVEESKGGGVNAKAFQAWNSIPEADRVTRNGVRYVKSTYRGQPQLVRWVGERAAVATSDARDRKMSSVTMRDAMKMTTAELKRLLAQDQPENVKKVLNSALREKTAKKKPEVGKV